MKRNRLSYAAMILRMALACALSGFGAVAYAEVFAMTADTVRVTLSCEGPAVVDTPCRFGAHQDHSAQPVRFVTEPADFVQLLSRGVAIALGEPQHPSYAKASEVAILKDLDFAKCHLSSYSEGDLGGLLVACHTAEPTVLVLYMRGVCDGCVFIPYVLRRQGAQ